jgi:glycosyltransferase involved in cell wall biosynthesis
MPVGIWAIVGGLQLAWYALNALIHLVLLTILRRDTLQYQRDRRVSILVAARNEEANILKLLQSLARQDYPTALLDIHIGDDSSEDRTAAIIQSFIRDKPHFHYHRIDQQYPGQRGKQNVLAHLFHQAQGELILITDADIEHHPDWTAAYVGAFGPGVDLVTGPTLVDAPGLGPKMQALDWLKGVSVIRALEQLRKPITAVGNNMGITREAYWRTGGYENIPFSITEDYKLFATLRAQGGHHRWLFHPVLLNRSAPIRGLRNLIQQRKRWFKGGKEGPWYALAVFAVYAMQPWILVASYFVWPWQVWLSLAAGTLLLDTLALARAGALLGRLDLLRWIPLHLAAQTLQSLVMPILFAIPSKVVWKGRKY